MAREFIRKSRRQILRIIVVALAVGCLPGRGMAGADEPKKAKDVSEQIVDTMNAIFGKHPGYRAAHAKGIVCEGEFTPAPTAAGLSRAPHLLPRQVSSACCCILTRRASEGSASEPALARWKIGEI